MAVLALMEPGVKLGVHAGALVVSRNREVIRTVRPVDVEIVELWAGAELTAAARGLLLRRGIDVVFIDLAGRWAGRLVGPGSRAGERRLAWYRLVTDPARRLELGRGIITGKIANQRTVLLRQQQRLRDDVVASALARLRGLIDRIGQAADLDALRGFEGMAARVHFEGLGRALTNPAFRFKGRTRYPPRDPVNSCLSYGYTLLLARCESAVRIAGLDPYLGVVHEAGRGAPALALDLEEEFRPVVDRLVLKLINRRQLGPEDFRVPPADELGARGALSDGEEGEGAPPIYLGRVGREIMLRAWEAELARRVDHPTRDGRWSLRELIVEQAHQLARICADPELSWQPVRL